MCADDEVAGDVVLERAVPKCLSIVCLLDDPSTGDRHEGRDVGVFQQLSCFVFHREDSAAKYKLFIRCVRRCSVLTIRYRAALAWSQVAKASSCGSDGKAKVQEELIRDLLRWCERQHCHSGSKEQTCQSVRQSGRHRSE